MDDELFHRVLEALEDVLMDSYFTELQSTFFNDHMHLFNDKMTPQTKAGVHRDYRSLIVTYCNQKIASHNTTLNDFIAVSSGKENCCGDVFELIETLVDYHSFEESIISYREELEGKFKHLDDLLRVTKG